jgi:hypothetical protein
MNAPTLIQDLELWEAWIEFDHLHSNRFGILYVLGEAPVNATEKTVRMVKAEDETDPGKLILTIPRNHLPGKVKMKEVIYSEPVSRIGHYHTIVINNGNDFLVEINDIEVLV